MLYINQSYHTEKNYQGALMSTIYKKADRVMVWFGVIKGMFLILFLMRLEIVQRPYLRK
jgi:hypothetical protein